MISETTIVLVKNRTDLVAIVGESVKLVRRGRSFVGLCPFHQEKTPSFHVNEERGFFHCFGCGESGSATDFIMKLDGYSFPEAIRVLAERAGIEIEEAQTSQERAQAAAKRQDKDDLYGVNSAAAGFFERALWRHRLAFYAREELAQRALLPEGGETDQGPAGGTLRAFRIGYAPAGWDALATWLRDQGISLGAAEKAGLLVPRPNGPGYYDRFRHRLMFAVLDTMGRVVAFSGRALGELTAEELESVKLQAPKQAPAKYINSPESQIYTKGEHLFGLHQAKQSIRQNGAILVEGNFDVVSLHAQGFTNTVAPLGTAFTPAQAKLLRRFSQNATILFDGDSAGKKATRAARLPCKDGGLSAKVASVPKGTDPDEFVRENGKAALQKIVDGARGILETVLDDLLDHGTFAASSLEEQSARIQEVMALIAGYDSSEVAAMATGYADRLASALAIVGAPVTTIRELKERLTKPVEHRTGQPEDGPQKEIVGALLDFPSLMEEDGTLEVVGRLSGDWALAASIVGHETPERYPESIRGFVSRRMAVPMIENIKQARNVLLDNATVLGTMGHSADSFESELKRWNDK